MRGNTQAQRGHQELRASSVGKSARYDNVAPPRQPSERFHASDDLPAAETELLRTFGLLLSRSKTLAVPPAGDPVASRNLHG